MRRVQKAWQRATELLEEHGVRRAPVDVRALASRYAHVVERALDDDVSGVLIPIDGGEWAIVVNDAHSPVRQRFTIAHELGHLLLHGYTAPHADRRFQFRDARSSEGSALEEVQANQFAAELLMPRALVLKAARNRSLEHGADPDADADFAVWIADLAERFAVSRQAMTIRLSSLFV